MKTIVLLSAVLAMACAKPGYLSYPGYNTAPVQYAASAPVHYTASAPVHYAAAAPVYQQYHQVASVAAPLHYQAPVAYHSAPVQYAAHHPVQYTAGPAQYAHAPAHYPAPLPGISTRYHGQTEVGVATFGYSHPGQAASEVRDAAGNVQGEYAYVNPDGKEVRVTYTADAVNGFSAKSNLVDEVVQDTPEVVEARAAHLKAVEEATASAKAALDKALKDAAEKENAKKA